MDINQLNQRFLEICHDFEGDSEKLRNAMGAALLCQYYGWKTIKLTHSYRSWKRYQELLRIDFQQEFAEETEIARKFMAYKVWKTMHNFWDTQKGRTITPKNKKAIIGLDA